MINNEQGRAAVSTDARSQRILWIGLRQALLVALGALEDYLGLERSVTPKHVRRAAGSQVGQG
jgi:hypothetical protein